MEMPNLDKNQETPTPIAENGEYSEILSIANAILEEYKDAFLELAK